MRIACVGGGPGGLFVSILLARAGHTVDVFERDSGESTFGFGVVFSRFSVARLRSAAPEVVDEIMQHGVRWQSLEVRYRDQSAVSFGHGFAAVERRALLRVLRARAVRSGARLFQSCQIKSVGSLDGYDVVVAADGARSGIRQQLSVCFRPTISYGGSRYIWFGVNRRFSAMTFLLTSAKEGLLGAHVYPYSETSSTFLVETSEEVWRKAGFASDAARSAGTDERALKYCQYVFAEHLAGGELIGNASRWLTFCEVRNDRWSGGRVVLLGDAAHTAHFSVGSGTSMAMEDAGVLARCLERSNRVEEAFQAYEAARQPVVAGLQMAAWASSQLWERLHYESDRDAGQLLLRLLTRTGQTDMDALLRTDPKLPVTVRRPLYAHPQGQTVVAVPLNRSPAAGTGSIAILLRTHEIKLLDEEHLRKAEWAYAALVVDLGDCPPQSGYQIETSLGELRSRIPRATSGILFAAQSSGTPNSVFGNLLVSITELITLSKPDFVSVACSGPIAAARTVQMLLCDAVKSAFGIRTIYACESAHIAHGWTHVEAARADEIWCMDGPL